MRRVFCYILVLIVLVGGADLKGQSKREISISEKIKTLNEQDSSLFKSVNDTISWYAGRNLDKAFEIARLLQARLHALKNDHFHLLFQIQLSQLFLLKGVPDSSEYHISLGLERAISTKDSSAMISLYYLKGWLFQEQNMVDIAQEAYFKGLRIAENTKDYYHQVTILSGLSMSYENMEERVDTQIELLKQAIEIGQKHNITDDSNFTSALYNLAAVYQENGRQDSALLIYDQLKARYIEDNYISGLASIANNVAHIHLKNRDFEKALNSAFAALEYDRQTGTKMYVVGDMMTIAKVYKSMGNNKRAIFFYQQADSLSKATGMLKRRMEITQNIALLYEESGNYKDAYNSLKNHIEARDTFNVVQTIDKTRELEKQYKLEQKEAENEMLKKEKAFDKQRINLQLSLIVLLVAGILTVMSFFILDRKKKMRIEKLNKSLKDSNEALETANKTKDKFFSVISHDLIGPMGSLNELLKVVHQNQDDYKTEEIFYFLKMAQQRVNIIYTLLTNLLIWSRTQFGKIVPKPVTVSLKIFVDDVLAPLYFTARNKNINIELDFGAGDKVVADSEMLAFIFRNLVSNAIKFSSEGDVIHVAGKMMDAGYKITVSDNGTGMTDKQINDLFKLNVNNSTRGTNDEPGTGLGLILTKEFATVNNIGLNVISQMGKGTTIEMCFEKAV